jgi:sulfite dehydrogenase (quinone) subunit SoeC
MKPAFSVIFFTVASGAGLGMFALLGLLDLADAAGLLGEARLFLFGSGHPLLLASGLVVAGLCASTLHLANPRNAWRSFTRFRTSWLSREAVFALAFVAVATLYVAMHMAEIAGFARVLSAIVIVGLAWSMLICTAMIYASLKPIRQWHTSWTPAAYVALGHWSGAVLLRGFMDFEERHLGYDALTILLGIAACGIKWTYWRTIDSERGSIALERAIGVDHGVRPPMPAGGASIMRARLLDTGHTHGTFLTDEFGFSLARRHRAWLRATFWIAGMATPLAWIVFGLPGWRGAAIAGAACMIGLLAERWLFFAEARHTVRLYHGDSAT